MLTIPQGAMTRDTATIRIIRTIVREAYVKIGQLPQHDSAARETRTRLDEICVELSCELADAEPELAL